jgi:hypothetical protein
MAIATLVVDAANTIVSSRQGRVRSWSAYPAHRSSTGLPRYVIASDAPISRFFAKLVANAARIGANRSSQKP